jgi:hypothetical protein
MLYALRGSHLFKSLEPSDNAWIQGRANRLRRVLLRSQRERDFCESEFWDFGEDSVALLQLWRR